MSRLRDHAALLIPVLFLWLLLMAGKASAFCFEEAAEKYDLSADLLKAIARVESGFKPDAVNKNKDGSYDYGLMQINSRWYDILGKEVGDDRITRQGPESERPDQLGRLFGHNDPDIGTEIPKTGNDGSGLVGRDAAGDA